MSYGWEPVDLTAAEFAADPEPPSIAGLLYDGKRHVISGPPESLKTLVAWIIVLEAQSIRVAHIDFEMGATATRKMLDELGAPRDWIRTVYHVEPDRPPTAENIDAIVAADVKLAIIDAAAGAFDVSGLDDNKRSDAEAFARAWIRPLWQAGITTLLVDHVTKNADTRGKFTIGTERKVGQADVHLGLEAVKHLSRGGNGLVKVHVHKDRVGFLHRPYAAEINVTSDPDTHRLTWTIRPAGSDDTGDGWRPTHLMDRVLDHLSGQTDPVGRNEIARAIKGKREYVLRAIDCLITDGRLTEQPGPNRARLISVVPGSQ